MSHLVARLLVRLRSSRLALTPLLLLVSACQTPEPATPCGNSLAINNAAAQTASAPGDIAAMASIGRRGVQVLDPGLSPLIYVDNVQVGRRPNGSVEVAARLVNCTAAPLQIQGATQFFSSSGGEAGSPSVWKRVFLPAQASRSYSEISTNSRPAGFLIEIRGGD